MIGKNCFYKNKYHIGVVHVLSFHPSARSSSFFSCIFSSLLWKTFLWITRYLLSIGAMPLWHNHFFKNKARYTALEPTNGPIDGRTDPLIEVLCST